MTHEEVMRDLNEWQRRVAEKKQESDLRIAKLDAELARMGPEFDSAGLE
jgi:hypothetical protein